ncbi:MAG: putative histidine kinase, hybrid [Herbaspirillum sp.]|jgi:signal transduction histidine kinase|nr:putative histidine kinase, hybrid [Herbaspirillum sp.]
MRTRTWLLYIVLAVLVPAFIVAAVGIVYVYREEQTAFRKSMRETAHALASLLDKEMTIRETALRALAASPALDTSDLAAFQKHARAIADPSETIIFLSDPQGRQLMNTHMPIGAKNLPQTKSLTEQRRLAGPEALIVSDLYQTPVRGAYSVAVQVPVKRNGVLLYYLGMGALVNQLQSIFSTQKLPSEWLGTIVDRQGTIAARSKDATRLVGQPISKVLNARVLQANEGQYDGVNLDGVRVAAFFSRAPVSGWTFIVSVPQTIVHGSAVRATTILCAVWLSFASIAIIAALALARRTSQPIEALRNAAEQLGRGEPVSDLQSGIVEVDAVSLEMRRASERLLRGKAEMEEQVAEAVSATARSQRALLQAQKLEALGRLTGGIAHDFNNVLQAISTGLHVVRLSGQDQRSANALDACQRAVKRAAELTGQLAVFGRTQESRLEVCALDEQLKAIRPLLESAIRSDIHLHMALDSHLWPIRIDTLQFELAVLNIVINARDAMPEGGRLEISASNIRIPHDSELLTAGDYVQLTFADSGFGMDSEVLTMALEPFFTTKAVGKGSGMGLPQAYGFAKQANGALMLESKLGEGTRVVIYMARSAVQPRAPVVIDERPSVCSGGVILFVEDDALVRDVVAPALVDTGFQVETAASGDEAYRILQSGKQFDILFSDIVMPGTLSGIDLAELAKREFPAMRVILASGYSDRVAAAAKVQVLPKPYSLHALIATLSGEPAEK